ncbi:hypothetical protein BGZ67_005625 [Mortierella alpina]|nr:hypothetical protein BGZ67_005625 [Mortierella alpina]
MGPSARSTPYVAQRSSSASWSHNTHATPPGLDRIKDRLSFTSLQGPFDLEESLFNSKGRKPWSWSRIKRLYKRQTRPVRLATALSGGIDSRILSRQLRAKNIVCNPRISRPLPLPPKVLSNGTHDFDPTVIVLSFDGLRADYLSRGHTPNILSVGTSGVVAEYMQPSFPTLTFPNHYTMGTGLFPSSHGIVSNMFYDPTLDEDFNYRIPDKSWDPKWWGGEPIWETAVLQNQRSGVIMWPGGESLRPVRPTYHVRYRSSTPVAEKMDTLLAWLDLPREERPTVMNVYISEVDTAGHNYGPDSKRCQRALAEVDTAVGILMDGLRQRGLDKVVNLLLVSDHGMSYVTPTQSIYYDDYIDPSELLLEESLQPHLAIRPKDPKRLDHIYKTLKSAQEKYNLQFKVYKRHEIPERYNYAHHPRIAPVVAIAEPGFVMTRRDMGIAVVGVHGWDHEAEEMRAIFMASGPSFPSHGPEKLQALENVELYEIIARTVGLQVKEGATDGVRNGYVSRPC